MKLSKPLAFSAGVALIALGTVAVVQIRREIKKTQESIREMVREAAVEAGREAGKEVRAGLIEGMDNVGDRVEEMPGRIFDSATNELQQRFTGFAERIGGDGQMPGRVLENVLDLVGGPAEPDQTEQTTSDGVDLARDPTDQLRDTLSSVIERVDGRGGDLPRIVLGDVLGDAADLPDPPNASDDGQASSGSTSREPSALVPGDLDEIRDRYIPRERGGQPLESVDRILDESGINVGDLLDGILGPARRSNDPGYDI
jgi:hypothetical protein